LDLQSRKEIARYVLSRGITDADAATGAEPAAPEGMLAARIPTIPFPSDLVPTPAPITPAPGSSDPLPKADVVVITWTVDEADALANVLTPGTSRTRWYPYARDFDSHYRPLIRSGAPSQYVERLASYMPTTIGQKKVLCMKSELHLNQDGIRTGDGTATLPVKDLFVQIIEEVQPEVVLTIGTSGSVFQHFQLGDVVVTRAAKFRCKDEFRNEKFNGETFTSDWTIPLTHIDAATSLMQTVAPNMAEPPMLPPTINYHYHGSKIHSDVNVPDIKLDGRDMPEFHPILTTDYFEYGTSTNHLDLEGAAVEMGDAALGLAVDGMADPPKWAVVRNMSDPQINGDIPNDGYDMNPQTMWAVGYYTGYGYYTSVSGAIATWGIIAGL